MECSGGGYYTAKAKAAFETIAKLGLEGFPILIAKPQCSSSPDCEMEIAAGAGFLIIITGDVMRMPGLPSRSTSGAMDIADNGEIIGLF